MNTHVNLELAELLKLRGFDKRCEAYYHTGGILKKQRVGLLNEMCEAPTISDVIMWLYEKHGIWIAPLPTTTKEFVFGIYIMNKPFALVEGEMEKAFSSPTEAYLEAIKHVLKTLL